MNNNLYLYKAHKYYKKYINLKNIKNMKGGSIDKLEWYDSYLTEVDEVYDQNYVITGSCAVSIYLNYFNNLTNGKFNEFISNLRIPNDVDFLYYCKGADYESRRKMGKYNRLQDSPQRSITYEFNSLGKFPTFIKSFDLTCLAKINYVQLDKYKVLSLDKLLEFYLQELEDNELFVSTYRENVSELEDKIEELKKHKKIKELLILQEEYDEFTNKLEKINYKILTLNLKINILNNIKDALKIDSELRSNYMILNIPDLTVSTQNIHSIFTTPTTPVTPTTLTSTFSPNIIQRLFSIDTSSKPSILSKPVETSDNTLTDLFGEYNDSDDEYADFKDHITPKTPTKLDFKYLPSGKTEDYETLQIKFDFE